MSKSGVELSRLRAETGLSRERVVRELDPPASTKTLERWEKDVTPVPGWRRQQLLALYAKHNGKVAAA